MRFEFKFALPVLVALLHDILITLGVYSLTGREMTTATVAAILTILGYSIYDTIIIFDRVRENIPLMRRSSFARSRTSRSGRRSGARSRRRSSRCSRSPRCFVFGGDTLKDFAFALLVGIASGAYSTIFIATPLLVILKEREPEYAKRKDAGLREKLDVLDPEAERPRPRPVEEAPAEAVDEPVVAPEPDGRRRRRRCRAAARGARRAASGRTRPHGRAR